LSNSKINKKNDTIIMLYHFLKTNGNLDEASVVKNVKNNLNFFVVSYYFCIFETINYDLLRIRKKLS